MNNGRNEARSILDATPRLAKWTWITNGTLFAIGASVSTLSFFLGSGGIVRPVDAPKESAQPDLFAFPFFQLVLFLMPLFIDLNWRGFQSAFYRSEQFQRARNAKYREMDSVLLYSGMCAMMICMESIALVMALASALARS